MEEKREEEGRMIIGIDEGEIREQLSEVVLKTVEGGRDHLTGCWTLMRIDSAGEAL